MSDLSRLRPWQRFHVRVTSIYGLTLALLLVFVGVTVYRTTLNAAVDHLQARMLTSTAALAESIDGDQLVGARLQANEPWQKELRGRFERIGALERDIDTVYLLRHERGLTFRFAADWAKDKEEAKPGEEYKASGLPILMQALGEPAVEDRFYRDKWGWSLSAYAPVRASDGTPVGIVGMDIDAAQVRAIRVRVFTWMLGGFAVSGLIIAVLSSVVAQNLREPLVQIIGATDAIDRGDYAVRLDVDRDDEFGILGGHFDAMAAGLQERQRIRATFGRYVSEEVARAVLDASLELGGEEREVTVLFCDLQGYSTLAEGMPPTRLVGILNAWLGAMQDVIDAHEGVVIEFLGDSILAVFGAPLVLEDHPARAIACARGMRDALTQLEDRSITGMRIGVHTGVVVAGNIGSRTRMKYGVIGDAVNVAARLEQLNKELGTSILISGATRDRVPDLDGVVDRGNVEVKGRSEPVRVWQI